ncbi:MAG: hypothetical protein AAFX45_00610 [Pseudomonadota bacterium]
MSMSFADGFRTLQAVRDLRVLVAQAPVEAQARIASGIPHGWMAPDQARAALKALTAGDRLADPIRSETISALQKAAALPHDDFPTFIFATLLVLEDVLNGATPVSEIEHHWATFRGHYRAAQAVERAAIAQAIRRVSLVQDAPISMPQSPADRTTASAAALKPLLEAKLSRRLTPAAETEPEAVAALLIKALSSPQAAQDAAELWRRHGADFLLSMPNIILAGFRHVYEAWDGFSPQGGPMIPLLDPPPGVEWPH